MLQNKKYIKFAYDNTVEVLSLSALDKGIQANDKKAATYKAKDGKEYLVQWPNLTVEDVNNLRSSKASTYNKSGKIPYTAIVNPHTGEEMDSILGGFSVGSLMERVEIQKKSLNEQYGKSLKRKDLEKLRKQEEKVRANLTLEKLPNALRELSKLQKMAGENPALVGMATQVGKDVIEACGKKLDELEALVGRGEAKAAKKELGPLSRALKGTELEARANELLEKAKAAA